MPNMTLDDIEKAQKALDKQLEDYTKDYKKLQTQIDKTMMEYKTVAGGLYEGNDLIEQTKKELTAAYATWNKMFDKLGGIKVKLAQVTKDASATLPGFGEFDKEVDKLLAALPKCGGDVKDIKDEDATLKNLKTQADKIHTEYNNIIQQADSPPKDPPKPTPYSN